MALFRNWLEAVQDLLTEEELQDRVSDLENWTIQKEDLTGSWDRWEDPGDYPSGAGAGPLQPGPWYLLVEGSWTFSIKLPSGTLTNEGDIVYANYKEGKMPLQDFLNKGDFPSEARTTMKDEVSYPEREESGDPMEEHDLKMDNFNLTKTAGGDIISFVAYLDNE